MLRFRSHGPSPDTYLGLGVAALFLAGGLIIVAVDPGLATGAVAVLCAVVTGLFALPAIYSAWGTVVIDRDRGEWVVCYQLGRWKRLVRFEVTDTRATERCVQNSRGFGTRAGLHLLVHVADRSPVRIGGGFSLKESELRAIEELITPGVNFR